MKKIEKLRVSFRSQTVGTLSLADGGKLCAFEYDPTWLAIGFSISPIQLPLQAGVFLANPMPFSGNFGVFEDSMPDGYGRYLLSKTLRSMEVNTEDFSALEYLSIVGESGMGALCYTPSQRVVVAEPCTDFDLLQKKAIEVLRAQQSDDASMLLYNSGNSGGARPKAIYTDDTGHWLVKFRHIYDAKDIGLHEYKCNALARACGITVADFKLVNNRYFASRRFDIDDDDGRLHVVTAGGLLGISVNMPVLDYSNLLALTGYLTQSDDEVIEMYRRMVFNYCIGNNDDHAKNFSFIACRTASGQWGWRLAPAYDLTHNEGGYNGQHATSVNGTGHPIREDMITVGVKIGLSERLCSSIIEMITDVVKKGPLSVG